MFIFFYATYYISIHRYFSFSLVFPHHQHPHIQRAAVNIFHGQLETGGVLQNSLSQWIICNLKSEIVQCFILSLHAGIYFSVCLALMVISLLETVIITNVLHHNSMKYQEVPNWVRVVVLKHIANLICYRWPEDIQPPSVAHKDQPPESSNSSSVQPAGQTQDQHPANNGGTQQNQYQNCVIKNQSCSVAWISGLIDIIIEINKVYVRHDIHENVASQIIFNILKQPPLYCILFQLFLNPLSLPAGFK